MGDASIEPDFGLKKAEQLMSSNLCGSQLDLFMHGEGDPFAPGHAEPHKIDNEINEMFLESEKTRISHKPNSTNKSNVKESGKTVTETTIL